MDISSSLIAKGTAGALAAAATTAGVIYRDQLFGKSNELTKFDWGLIDFLNDGGDIVFDVKKGNGTDDLQKTDFTFNSSNKTLTVKVSVNTSNTSNLIEKSNAAEGDHGKISTLKKLNGNGEEDVGTDWTWTCEVKFEAKSISSLNGQKLHEEDKMFKSDSEGLFPLLKKNVSGEGDNNTKKKTKRIKEKFIRFCAKKRNKPELKDKKTLTDLSNTLTNSKEIILKLGENGVQGGKTDTNKLYPSNEKDDRKFNELLEMIK